MSEKINIVVDADLTPLVPILTKAVAERRNVICDLCGRKSRGTKEELIASGWQFPNGSEFCPDHE